MRKSFRMFFALALVMLGVVSVNAQERISLQEVGFHTWDGWDGNAAKTGDAGCAWEIGVSTGLPYGDPSVNNYADLTLYSKLYVTVTEGSPRVLFNRLKEEGQGGDTFEDSYLVDIPNRGWCTQKYQTIVDNVYIYDLKAIAKDYGFVHLHAIKGANWANVTVESLELETSGKAQQVGWTELTTNAGLDGDDLSSFVSKELPSVEILPSTVVDTVGVNGGHGIVVKSIAGATNDWDSQFWIVAPEALKEGTKYRVTFDYKATKDVSIPTQAHGTPGNYIHYEMIGNVNFTTEWQSFKYEGELTAAQAHGGDGPYDFQSIAFNLSVDKANDVEFYFDNIRFEEYKYGVTAEYAFDVIELDFGFDTNLPALVAACGKPRLMFPSNCVNVKVDGAEAEVMSVEGLADGRFYIFMNEPIDEGQNVEVVFANPADAAFHLTYDGGPGGDIKDFSGAASYNYDVAMPEDAYAYLYVTPTLMEADPENGSFNLPNNISEFKVTFDKNVDCAALVAKLGNEALTVEPADGFAESIVLKRTSATDLVTGEYALNISKIYPEARLDDEIFGDTTYVFNVGKVSLDPADTLRQLIPDYFAAVGDGGIPEGWYMVYDGNKLSGSAGSGARMRTFSEGGDFTRGFYTRTNNDTPDMCIVEYGSVEGYELTLEAGKKYKISYNLLSWKGATYARFEIYNPNGEIVHTQVDECKGTANGNINIVITGSNFVEYTFVPEESGNYRVRWTPSNGNGDLTGGMNEIIFANPKVTYLPNAAGVVETQNLLKSLNAAKSVLAAAQANENYAGVALNALAETVAKYEAEYEGYTNPSAYTKAIAALDEAAKVMSDHRALCDTYYALPDQLRQIVENNAEKKFAGTDLYAELKAMYAEYVTKIETPTTETNPETGETTETIVVSYEYKKIYDDAELQAAIAELQVPVNTAGKLFTEGASKATTTGIAALVERLRLGAEALKSLGVAEDDELVQRAYNALDDDDDLAEELKIALKKQLYGILKDPSNKLFEEKYDSATLETYTDQYDMTVFVKNPNIYRLSGLNFMINDSTANVPGWVGVEGYNVPGLSWGWNDPGYDISDAMFQTWGASYAAEQTIVDLPAGVYTIKAGFGERNDEASTAGSFFYVKTSATPAGEYADSIASPVIGQAFPNLNIETKQVVVADGMLTIGVVGGPSSHTFFESVQLLICGADETTDYAGAYEEIVQGIETTVTAPAQVLGIELYDLNGRRITKAQKGIVIMRKFMSDGSIKVEKILKK